MRSIPPELLAKIKGQNQTIWNNANPKMSVVVARAKSSVRDSTYFTIEKIREKEGITDVAVSARRQKPIGPPDRIYGIHIDNGMAKTSLREYPDKLKEHWKPQFDVEPSKGVSIVFDGRWHMNYKKTWGLVTDELPWIFWIDSSNNLKARIWNTGDIYTLSTNVSKVDTVRGWIPAQAGHTDDQGIIAAYVKTDGKIYYRNYCMQSTGLFIWETEKEMTDFGTGCTGVRLFRTNDFRVGFLAEKSAGNLMAITVRNWAGMSIAPEKLHAKISATIDFIPLVFTETEPVKEYLATTITSGVAFCGVDVPEPDIIGVTRSGKTKLLLEFPLQISSYENSEAAFNISNLANTYSIESMVVTEDLNVLEITLEEEVNVSVDITIQYNSLLGNICLFADEYCIRPVNTFIETAEGRPQDGFMAEYLAANISASIAFIELDFKKGFANEYLDVEITATIQFWDIDNAPL